MTTLRVKPTMQDIRTIARAALLTSVAIAAVSMARGAAAADTQPEPGDAPRAVVSYADLNLASPQDAKKLLQRIAEAATQVCSIPAASVSLSARTRERGCISAAIARAVNTVASEKLTIAYYQSGYAPRYGQPLGPRAASIAATPGR